MRSSILAVSVGVTLSIVAAAQPSAQQPNPLGDLIQKAKDKLAKPKIVECRSNDQACIDNARKAGAAVKLIDPPAAPAPAPGQASPPPAQAPPPSASGNQTTGAGFDAPEPDHASLFKLYLAANADVLGDDKSAAWEHYLLFRVPPADAPQRFSPECRDLQTKVSNEITAQTLLDGAVRDFKQALVAAQSSPRTAMFTLRTRERLKVYDVARNVFQLDTIGSSMLVDGAKIPIGRDGDLVQMTQYRRQSSRTWCRVPVA